jgi:hypothetical protein
MYRIYLEDIVVCGKDERFDQNTIIVDIPVLLQPLMHEAQTLARSAIGM